MIYSNQKEGGEYDHYEVKREGQLLQFLLDSVGGESRT